MNGSSMPRVVTFDQVKYTGESAGEIPIHKMLTWMGRKWAASIATRLGIEEELTLADVVAQHVNDAQAKLEPEEVSILARLISCFGLTFVGHPQYQMGTLITSNDGWRREEWMYAKGNFMEDLRFFGGSTHLCRHPEPTVIMPPPSSTLPSAKTAITTASRALSPTASTKQVPVQKLGDSVEACFSPILAKRMQEKGFRTLTDFPPKTQRELCKLFGGRGVASIKDALARHGMKLAEPKEEKKESSPKPARATRSAESVGHNLAKFFTPKLIGKIVDAGITSIEQFANYSEAQLRRMFHDDERTMHRIKFETNLRGITFKPSTEHELNGARCINKAFPHDIAQSLSRTGSIHCVADVAALSRARLLVILHTRQRVKTVVDKLSKLGYEPAADDTTGPLSDKPPTEPENAQAIQVAPELVRGNGAHNGNGNGRQHLADTDTVAITIMIPVAFIQPGQHILITIGPDGTTQNVETHAHMSAT